MKYILQILLIFPITLTFSQDLNLNVEFSWKQVEKKNPALIDKFINSTPNEFQYYKEDESYLPTISDLKKDLHVIDLNNDKLDDIVFDGHSGGEPREISIYINNGNSFSKVFTDYQEILKMEFVAGKLSKLNIKDGGCCAEYIVTNKFYEVTILKGEWKFKLSKSLKYVDRSLLPDKFWTSYKKVQVLNNDYNLRFAPIIDDTTETGFDGEPTKGNTIGKISKDALAIAMAESTDKTGRVWFFVAVYPEYNLKETFFYDSEDELKGYKCGWISSRFIEIQK